MDKKIEQSFLKRYLKPLLISVIIIVSGWTGYEIIQSDSDGQTHRISLDKVTVDTVSRGQFVNSLKLRSQVVPRTTVYLDTISGGQIEERLVEQGMFVEKGQPLVRLTNTRLQLDVMSREAQVTEQLNFLRNTQMTMATNELNLRRDILEIERQINHLTRRNMQLSKLLQKGVVAKEEQDQIEQDLLYFQSRKALTQERQKQENSIRQVQLSQLEDSAKMLNDNLQFARKNLENLVVKAPVSGFLSDLNAEIGESKPQGARLGQIDLPNEFKLVAHLDEFYLNQVQVGMPAHIHINNTQIEAKVSKINSTVNQSQFSIEVDLPSAINTVMRGQNIDLDLMLGDDNNNSLLLSRGAFFNQTGGHWVFVIEPGAAHATRKTIRLGKQNQQFYEVLDGLALNDKVIISSYSSFDNAQKLKF